jgi:tetratricopeptide (TPR) repeat protein
LGSILDELHRFTEALQLHKKALEVMKAQRKALQAMEFEQDSAELEEHFIKLRYSIGNTYEKSGRRGMALAQMEGILKVKPDDAGAKNFIGYTLLILGKDLDRAEKLIRGAAEAEPDDGYITDSLGWVHFKKGQYEEAVKLIKKAAELADSDPIIYDHLGDALKALNRTKEAAEAYRKSLEINPENLLVQDKLKRLEKKGK